MNNTDTEKEDATTNQQKETYLQVPDDMLAQKHVPLPPSQLQLDLQEALPPATKN